MKNITKLQKWLTTKVKKQKLKEKLTIAMTANPLSGYNPSNFSDADLARMEQQYQQRKAQAFWA